MQDNSSISGSCHSSSTIETVSPDVERTEREIERWEQDGRFQNLSKTKVRGTILCRTGAEQAIFARWDNEVSVARLGCVQDRKLEQESGRAKLIWTIFGAGNSKKTEFIVAGNCPVDFLIGTMDQQPFEGVHCPRLSKTVNSPPLPLISRSSCPRQLEDQPSTVLLKTCPLQPAPRSAIFAATSTRLMDSNYRSNVDVASQLRYAAPAIFWSVLWGVLPLVIIWLLLLVVLRNVLQLMLVKVERAVEYVFRTCMIIMASLAAHVFHEHSLLRRIWGLLKRLE